VKNPLPASSRYAAVEIAALTRPDGSEVSYLRRRLVPDPARFETILEHVVAEGDRLDNITYAYLDDPEQFWRICDPNRVLRPTELTDELSRPIRITLPEGIAGPRDA